MTAEGIVSLLDGEMAIAVDLELASKLARYLQLLIRWNARTNLTAIRDEREIVLRHFGESLQCAQALPPQGANLLDYGSGAGFPGLVCSLAHPGWEVLLAESQGKKASFLQEACRFIPARARVHAGRVEVLPTGRQFDIVTMRAVDNMDAALESGVRRLKKGGMLALMTTFGGFEQGSFSALPIDWFNTVALRGTQQAVVALGRKV